MVRGVRRHRRTTAPSTPGIGHPVMAAYRGQVTSNVGSDTAAFEQRAGMPGAQLACRYAFRPELAPWPRKSLVPIEDEPLYRPPTRCPVETTRARIGDAGQIPCPGSLK